MPDSSIPTRLIQAQDATLLIDRLQFTADVTNLAGLTSVLSGARSIPAPPQDTAPFRPYRHALRWAPGVYIAHSPKLSSHRFLLMRFHPEAPDAVRCFKALLPYLTLSTATITGLDIAVDLPIALWDLQPIPTGKQKVHLFVGYRGVETIYFGARGAGQTKVYDKGAQLHHRGDDWHYRDPAKVPSPLTRIEATVGGVRLAEFRNIDNPFVRSWSPLPLYAEGLPFLATLAAAYARYWGWPVFRAHAPKAAFASLKKVLNNRARGLTVPSPAAVFEAKWSSVANDLYLALGLP